MIGTASVQDVTSVYNFNFGFWMMVRAGWNSRVWMRFMPTILIDRQCPQCQATDARLRPFNSFLSHVDYFRCPECGHAWNEPKAGEPSRLTDVTRRDKTPTAR